MIHPACALCRGACCEVADIPAEIQSLMQRDRWMWLVAHAQHTASLGYHFCSPCVHLKDGKCANYEHRFQLCRDMQVGGPDCRRVVRERRPKNWSSIIRLMEET